MHPNLNDIDEHILAIESVFDIGKILNRSIDNRLIAKYFRLNRPTYGLLHDRNGACHLLMDSKEEANRLDPYRQAKIVSKEIKLSRSKNVLELGAGKGINVTFLANHHKNVNFTALDLQHGQFRTGHFKHLDNIDAIYGDFNNLSNFKNETFDLVYIIEAFMYGKNPVSILKDIRRILTPGGLLVIIQDHVSKPIDKLVDNEKLAVELIHKSVMSPLDGRYYPDFKNNIIKAGFSITTDEILDDQVQNGLNRIENQAYFFLRFPVLLKIINKVVPLEMSGNVIICYLLPPIFRNKIHCYALTIAKK